MLLNFPVKTFNNNFESLKPEDDPQDDEGQFKYNIKKDENNMLPSEYKYYI